MPPTRGRSAPGAEIDEAGWSALYPTVSRPFDPPKTGRIAVKVINPLRRRGAEGLPPIVGGARLQEARTIFLEKGVSIG
ncbi:MAG: hypothetical protein ACLQOO_07970 [Terriglobia bacterium]